MERNSILVDASLLASSRDHDSAPHDGTGRPRRMRWQPLYQPQLAQSSSPKSCSDKLSLPGQKTPSGGPSTDEEVLTQNWLDYPCPSPARNTAACPS